MESATIVGILVVAAVVTLLLAIVFASVDHDASEKTLEKVRGLADSMKSAVEQRAADEGFQPHGLGVDFGGVAKVAEALAKLDRSGRFLTATIAFFTIAAAIAVVGEVVK